MYLPRPPRPEARGLRRAGQTMVFLLVIVVILALVVLWNFDLHKIIAVKLRSQNGGDSAALAAARWQGIALNLVGNLNVLQAAALSDALARGHSDSPEAREIADLEARLCFVGPMTGFAASQVAAKNNRMFVNSLFTAEVQAHAQDVLANYETRYPDAPYTNNPAKPGAWDDYGNMVLLVAGQGIAAAPDNMKFFTDFTDRDHLLLNPSFYDAISSQDWCWFFHNAYDMLKNYRSYQDWDALPRIVKPRPINSEYYSLGLTRVAFLSTLPSITPGMDNADVPELVRLIEQIAEKPITQGVARVAAQWYCYDARDWRPWTELIPDNFPFEGPVKKQYNYVGADAAVRIDTKSTRLTPGGGEDEITWSAAAKPFGTLEGDVPPNRYGLVLPAFHEARMIPVDTSTAPAGGSRPGWAEHIYNHLDPYLAGGLGALVPGCWYCNQLRTWEDQGFRDGGLDWLDKNSAKCIVKGGGGGGGGGSGGTRRGH